MLSTALFERWKQVCRVKITFPKLPMNRFVSTNKILMKCVVNWIPLRIRVRSRNTQPHLKTRLSVCSWKNSKKQEFESTWILVTYALKQGTKLLLQVIKVIINQCTMLCLTPYNRVEKCQLNRFSRPWDSLDWAAAHAARKI